MEKLAPGISGVVDKAVAFWKFVPVEVDGHPVTAKERMNLRRVATPLDDAEFVVRIKGASFGDDGVLGSGLTYTPQSRKVFPKYPQEAVRARVGGTVYLLVKFGPDGKVLDAVAQQVNLTVRGSHSQMAHLRDASQRHRWPRRSAGHSRCRRRARTPVVSSGLRTCLSISNCPITPCARRKTTVSGKRMSLDLWRPRRGRRLRRWRAIASIPFPPVECSPAVRRSGFSCRCQVGKKTVGKAPAID